VTKIGDDSALEPDGSGVPREPIRVLVADDHVLYRRGLELVLGQEPDIAIVGEAGDGDEAIARTEELLPDVILMDVRMPRRSGIEACSAIKEIAPSTKRQDERPAAPAPRLTERELEVLKLVARGMANKDIARELFISENTVKNHVRNILEKLQLHSRMEAAMYAFREKILDLPD